MHRAAAHLVAWLCWWVALFWLWLLLVGEWNRIEWVAAASAATVAATLAELARWRLDLHVRIPLRWIWRARGVPLAILVDFGIVMWLLLRSIARREVHRGRFRSHEFPAGGDDPTSTGVRAWAEITASYSPNALVVGVEQERQLSLLHDLVRRRKSEEPA